MFIGNLEYYEHTTLKGSQKLLLYFIYKHSIPLGLNHIIDGVQYHYRAFLI